MSLNPEQQLAVDHVHGPCVVTACPGSGKTTVLTTRVISLIQKQNVDPKNILCLTFTNKAANEMKERISAALGKETAGRIWVSTFHFLCLSLLRKYGDQIGLDRSFSIYDDKDQKELLKKIARMQEVETNDKIIGYIAKCVNDARENLEEIALEDDFASIAKEYLELINEFNAIDFSGMLFKTYELIKSSEKVIKFLQERFRFVLVDEGQDTNRIQYEVVKKISGHGNLFMVGDKQQAIFGFRGSKPENLYDIKKDFQGVREITLPRNYRSTSQILSAAQKLIRHNSDATNVELLSIRGNGKDVTVESPHTPKNEAQNIADYCSILRHGGYKWNDMAVLYRVNPQSQEVEMALRTNDIPYRIRGGFSFFDRMEIKTTLAYLSFLANPSDSIAFERAITTPSRRVAKTTIGKLERLCQLKKISILSACDQIEMVSGVSSEAKYSLKKFADVTRSHLKMQEEEAAIGFISKSYLDETGFYDFMKKESEKDETFKKRIENIDQLLFQIVDFGEQKKNAKIADYLQSIQLMMTDDEAEGDSVTLMTVHSSKGLEFPAVFIIGCEEGYFPHRKAVQSFEEVEEERRLMYVGATRAKDILVLSHCLNRPVNRSSYTLRPCIPSRFLFEMGLVSKDAYLVAS